MDALGNWATISMISDPFSGEFIECVAGWLKSPEPNSLPRRRHWSGSDSSAEVHDEDDPPPLPLINNTLLPAIPINSYYISFQ